MTDYFKPLPKLSVLRAPAKPKPPLKPKLASTDSPEWLSYAYRIEPGPGDKTCRDITNMHFQLKETYPAITLPESVYWWLCTKHGANFTYQENFNSGRAQLGGAVPDFYLPDYHIVILIQGIYWHSRPEAVARDLVTISAMKNGTIDGIPIFAVVQVSDLRIQSLQREEIFKLSLVGIEQFP